MTFLKFKKHEPATHPKPIEANYEAKYLTNAIFIVGSGKSGTTLLQGLFDYHPNLLVFPVESAYYFHYPTLISGLSVISIKKRFTKFWIKKSKFSWY